jgi:calcium-dependent protein kinase
MGTCHEQRADRTRFIIDEDYKIKHEMIESIRAFNARKTEEENKDPGKNISQLVPKAQDPPIKPNINMDTRLISKNKRDFLDIYEPKEPLGEGGYGQVYLVVHRKMKLLRALKMIPVNSNESGEKSEEEIEKLKQFDHPNIVKLFEYFIDNDKYLLITEYCRGGDLFRVIKKKKKFSELSAVYIMFQIFRALIYCHNTIHLAHRDIKPENIVIFKKNNTATEDLYDVKLIDFGIAKKLDINNKKMDDKIKGSLYYMAPEVFGKKSDEKCDIWSCGVVLYLLVTGKYPFNGKDQKEIIRNIKEGRFSFPEDIIDKLSNELRDLIKNCLQVNPAKRLSAKEALKHPIFNKYKINEYFIHVTPAFLNKTINNIKKYDTKNKLQTLCFSYFVHNYPNQDDIILINRVFSKFNTSNNGQLTEEELRKGLMKYLFKGKKNKDAAEKEANSIFIKLDDNKNGYIECEEFIRAGIDKKLLKSKKVLRFTFDFLDKDRNGEISIEELKEVFRNEGDYNDDEYDKNMIELVKSIDTDLNGRISFDEFYNMMIKVIDGLI